MINDRYPWFCCRFEWLTKENGRKIDHSIILLGIGWYAVHTSSIPQSRIKSKNSLKYYWIRDTIFNHKHFGIGKQGIFKKKRFFSKTLESFSNKIFDWLLFTYFHLNIQIRHVKCGSRLMKKKFKSTISTFFK